MTLYQYTEERLDRAVRDVDLAIEAVTEGIDQYPDGSPIKQRRQVQLAQLKAAKLLLEGANSQ